MTAEIRKRTASEYPPMPPVDRQIFRAVGTIGRRTEPEIVMHLGRDRRCVFGDLLAAIAGIYPDVNFFYGPDCAGLNQLDDPSVIIARMDLSSDLRHALHFTRRIHDDAAFGDAVRQPLFAIDMSPAFERRDGNDRMRVV